LLERCLWCKRAGLQDLPMVAIIYVTEQERLWVTETIRRLHFDKFTSTMVFGMWDRELKYPHSVG
jgi:hypothetical protein